MRTADAVGIPEVILGGHTPAPLDRFGREQKQFTKASLGAEKTVAWRCVTDCEAELKTLKKSGAHVVAVEQGSGSVDYKKVRLPAVSAIIVFGNEVSGLPQSVIALADVVAEIPMRGEKESLNVSVSAGIVLYRWFDC